MQCCTSNAGRCMSSVSPADGVPCCWLQCLSSWRVCIAGNPLTDPEIDGEGVVDFWHEHAIISADQKDAIKRVCNFSEFAWAASQVGHNAHTTKC